MNKPSRLVFAFSPPRAPVGGSERKRPVQKRSQATVDAILKATLQVLDGFGLQKLTTIRVAERAGVSVGTLYQYFPNKAALVAALQARDRKRMLAGLSAVTAAHRGRPLEAAMRALITATLEMKLAAHSYRLTFTDADGAMLGPLALVLAPLLPVKQAPTRAAILVAALSGPIMHAAKHVPTLLKSSDFVDELCALAMGYVKRCQKLDRSSLRT
jgi:AcrR family transcriptional regulator